MKFHIVLSITNYDEQKTHVKIFCRSSGIAFLFLMTSLMINQSLSLYFPYKKGNIQLAIS